MPFVNEHISDIDHERFRLDEIDGWPAVGAVHADSWTIDRERGIALRLLTVGREDWAALTGWTLWWHDHLLYVGLERMDASGPWEGPRSTHWTLRGLHAFASDALPPELEAERDAIVADLAQALQAYGEDGLVGPHVQHTLRLDA